MKTEGRTYGLKLKRTTILPALLAMISTGPISLWVPRSSPLPPSQTPPDERTPEDLERLARAQARRERRAARRSGLNT